jgi:PII-like signaling protein
MSLAMFAKKRVEIFVEAPALEQVTEALDAQKVQGYTVVEAISGRGHTGTWRLDDSFNSATNVVVVVCILDASKVEGVVASLFEIVRRQIGVLSVSDVMVVRSEHF